MAINIFLVNEDLKNFVMDLGHIDINNDYYQLRKITRELNLPITSTIDDCGDTIINKPQLEILKKEIQQLRVRADISQAILNTLQKAADIMSAHKYEYIRFIGD